MQWAAGTRVMRREEFNSLYYSIHCSASSVVAAVCCLSRASISVFTSALGYSFFSACHKGHFTVIRRAGPKMNNFIQRNLPSFYTAHFNCTETPLTKKNIIWRSWFCIGVRQGCWIPVILRQNKILYSNFSTGYISTMSHAPPQTNQFC